MTYITTDSAVNETRNAYTSKHSFGVDLYKKVLPMRRVGLAHEIAFSLQYHTVEHQGLDLDNLPEWHTIAKLYKKQRSDTIAFIKENCPRHAETGFWIAPWLTDVPTLTPNEKETPVTDTESAETPVEVPVEDMLAEDVQVKLREEAVTERENAVAAREAELDAREKALAAREAALLDSATALDAQQDSLDTAVANADERDAELSAAEEQLRTHAAMIKSLQTALGETDAMLEKLGL